MMQGIADEPKTRWPVVMAALLGGVAAGMQIAKASAVMPLLREEFGASVTAASFYLATVSLGAALLGLMVGLAAQRFGALRAGVCGLAMIAAASLVGSFATSWPQLFAMRLVEAAGLPLVVATMPAIVQSACSPERRVVGLGIWAAWLPLGVALAMFVTVAVGDRLGWRGLYFGSGLLPVLAIAALLTSRPEAAVAASPQGKPGLARRIPMPVLAMAAIFSLFTSIYLSFMAFLPSVVNAEFGLGLDGAALVAGVMALLVILGNLLATVLLVRGFAARAVMMLAFAVMGASAAFFFAAQMPVWLRMFACVAFNLAAGVAPGVIWTYVPRLSTSLGISAALVSGVFYQAAGAGQLLGPIASGTMIDAFGSWLGCLFVILPASGLAIWLSGIRSGGAGRGG